MVFCEKTRKEISSLLQYEIKDIELLRTALTRQSAISENSISASDISYQRLEFIGDSLLNLIVTKIIYMNFPNSDSGELSNLKQEIICNKALGEIAQKLNLGKYLIVGNSEEMGHIRTHQKTLADLIEALTAVVYIDSNKDFKLTQKVLLTLLNDVIKNAFIKRQNFLFYNKNEFCYLVDK